MRLNKKLHLSSSLAAGVINTSGLEFLMNRFSELGSGAGVPNNPDVPLEDRYATQLSQLQEMFFFGH